MDITRTSLMLAIVAIAVAAMTGYALYNQTRTVDTLASQVAALEREVGIGDSAGIDLGKRFDSIEERLDQAEFGLGNVQTGLSSVAKVNLAIATKNADAIDALEREINPLPGLASPGGNEIDQLRADLDNLTECVNLNMGELRQWSQYVTPGGFYGYTCNTG